MFMEKYYSLFVFKIFDKSKSFFFDLGTFDILIYYQLKLLFLNKLIVSLWRAKSGTTFRRMTLKLLHVSPKFNK